jgi:hypothetical protein
MSASFGALLAAARSISLVIVKAVPFLKPYFAQRSAAAAPEAFVASHQAMFETVFRRLQAADPHDSLFVRAYDGMATKLITPEFLRTDNVQGLTCSQILGPIIPGGRLVWGFWTGSDAAG